MHGLSDPHDRGDTYAVERHQLIFPQPASCAGVTARADQEEERDISGLLTAQLAVAHSGGWRGRSDRCR